MRFYVLSTVFQSYQDDERLIMCTMELCIPFRIGSESELFIGDTSKDNHSPGPVSRGVNP